MFSAGTDGTVFAWLIDKIFATEIFEDLGDRQAENKFFTSGVKDNSKKGFEGSEKEKMEYRNYTSEKTPWFVSKHSFASCIVDLPNIEQIATGSFKNIIELWTLRNDSADEKDEGKYGSNKNTKKIGGATSSSFGQSKTKGITEETATDE